MMDVPILVDNIALYFAVSFLFYIYDAVAIIVVIISSLIYASALAKDSWTIHDSRP